MPRNPNKRRCQKPGCRNWAMRAHLLCRSHLDHELGPRGAGAPYGNFNALRHGRRLGPEKVKLLRRIAYKLYEKPETLPDEILGIVNDLYKHENREALPRTLIALAALNVILEALVDLHADILFHAELDEMLSYLPQERVAAAQRRIWEAAVYHKPVDRVLQLCRAKPGFIANFVTTEQLPEPPSHTGERGKR